MAFFSSKTDGVGPSGLVKCVLMLSHGSVAPNVHFYSLNPHLDLNGYPCQISVAWRPHDSPRKTPQCSSKNGWHKGGPLVYLECKEQSHVAFVDSFMKHIKMKTRSFLLLPFFVGGSWFRSLVVKHWSEDGDHPFPISNRIASPVTWPKTPSSWGFGEVPNLNQPWFQVAEIYHI